MKNSIKLTLIALVSIFVSCTSGIDVHPTNILPEWDMFDTWNICYSDMRVQTSILLQANERLVKGDTLQAQQLLTSARYIVRGWEHSLNEVGTQWVGFGTSGSDTAFIFSHTTPGELTYVVPCPPKSKYNYSSTVYGCKTHYAITLTHIDTGVYLANGTGYINTDGSADLYFDMQDFCLGGPRSGKLTLTAYAHKYDETVVYHYTFYEKTIECDESKQNQR